MKKIFNYCVYRIASAYEKMGMEKHIERGYFLMFVSFTFYAMAITECLLSVFNMNMNRFFQIRNAKSHEYHQKPLSLPAKRTCMKAENDIKGNCKSPYSTQADGI